MSGLPRGWAWSTLGEIGDYMNGRGFRKSEWSDAGRPIIRIQNLTGTGSHFNYYDGEAQEPYIARRGDVLVSWAATLGVFVWGGPEAVVNQHIFKVRSYVDARFHRYLIASVLDELRLQTHGSGMVHITRRKFDETRVAIPPLAEQRRIVAAIEEQLSRLDAAEVSLRSASARNTVLRSGVLRELVGSGAPAPLKEVAQVVSGQTPAGLELLEEGPIPFYKVGDMNAAEGRSMRTSRGYLDDELVDRFRLHVRPAGTVIFPKRGGAIATNKKRILSCPAAFDLNTMGVVPGPNLDPVFLLRWFENVDLGSIADGSNVPQINHGDVEPLNIPLPPLEEQRRMVARVEAQLAIAETLDRAIEAVALRSASLRRAILTRAFRGELVPQDPDDEPASVLLERIAAQRAASAQPRRRHAPMRK